VPNRPQHTEDIPALTDFSFGRLGRHQIIKGADLIEKYKASASWKYTLGEKYYTIRSIQPNLQYFYDPQTLGLDPDRAKKARRRRPPIVRHKPPIVRHKPPTGNTIVPYAIDFENTPPSCTILPPHSVPIWVYSILSYYPRTDIRRHVVMEDYKKAANFFKKDDEKTGFFDKMLLEYTGAIIKEQRILNAINKLKYIHKRNKALANQLNDTDPFTLESPKHPIVCMQNGGLYVFEAHAIRDHFTALLNNIEYGFPKPQVPRNPLNNLPFHYGQIHHIRNQLVAIGYTNSTIEGYRECNYNMAMYKQLHYKKIQAANLANTVSSKNEFKNFFKYHVFQQMAYELPHDEYLRIRKIIWWSIDHVRSDYMELWKRHYRNYEMYNILYSDDSHELANLIDHEKYMMSRLYRHGTALDALEKAMNTPKKYVWNRRSTPMERTKRRIIWRQKMRRLREYMEAKAESASATLAASSTASSDSL
jgi:hypothetical protein